MPWVRSRDISFIGSDAALDVVPSQVEGVDLPVHILTIVAMGVDIFDNQDLEAVAETAAELGRWEFLLVAGPLAVRNRNRLADQRTGDLLRAEGGETMIDFEIPEETKAVRAKVRAFVQNECIPAEERCTPENFDEVLAELRTKARSQGLWCPFIPEEHGGMGLKPLANALAQMELGESFLGALSLNTQGPDDATMLTLLENGTEDQKERFLKPLLAGEKRICYSMTERAAGADATGMQTSAVLDGDNYVLNGEKWFSSSASVADVALVMAKTDPDVARHRQFSTFLVELPNPGYKIIRNIETMQPHTDLGLSSDPRTRRSTSRTSSSRRRTSSVAAARASRWASTASPTGGCVTACTTWRWHSVPSISPSGTL